MRQTRGHLDLAQEPLAAERGCEVCVECLEGDVAAVFYVVREVHRRHAANAELTLDAVAVSESAAEFGIRWSSD
jgi:hypothetical protein